MNWYKKLKFAANNKCDQQIQLNSVEQNIFKLLLDVKYSVSKLQNTSIVIVGGWVRDKLLGFESDDIDIALSDITGADFVQYIQQFVQSKNIEGVGKTYIVEENIEKSKHLATAGIDLFGQKVEFVNFRSEEYGDSRVPVMKMGTPQEDAERLD